jgi:predicted HTH domain antitoxin
MSRRDFLELLASEGIPLFDPTDADLEKEIETVRRLGAAS